MVQLRRAVRDQNDNGAVTSNNVSGGSPQRSVRDQHPVSGRPSPPRIPEAAVRPTGSIHLTLGVMSVTSPEKMNEAIALLNKAASSSLTSDTTSQNGQASASHGSREKPSDPIADEVRSGLKTLARDISRPLLSSDRGRDHHTPATGDSSGYGNPNANNQGPSEAQGGGRVHLKVDLKSLVSMHHPERTTVLYAEPHDASGQLRPACERLLDVFVDAGLIENDRALKLHATVLNTVYAKGRGRGRPPLIDATSLIEQFKDYVWADDIVLDKIAICKMGAVKITDDSGGIVDEQYEELATAPFLLP